MGTINPHNHRCDLRDIEYAMVDEGQVYCKVCGRIWDLGEHGWVPDPRPPMSKQQVAAMKRARVAKK